MDNLKIDNKTYYYNFYSDKTEIMRVIVEKLKIGIKLDDKIINENYIINDSSDFSQEFKRNSWEGVFKSIYADIVIIISSNLTYFNSVQYEIINMYKELTEAKRKYDEYNKDYENINLKFTKESPLRELENKYKRKINKLETEYNSVIREKDKKIKLLIDEIEEIQEKQEK